MIPLNFYDTIVVGAGHAGIEAALAAARAGLQTLLLTMEIQAIGRMSCNPSIGGIAKGHIVREIDAMGGEMGLAIDATAIQLRMLNRSKGPAVQALRAQADKAQYSFYMQRVIAREPNIDLRPGQAVEILVKDRCCYGIRTKEGQNFYGQTVILTTGTFLEGLIHVGEEHYPGGRRDEAPAVGLSDSLRRAGIELVRFKTGTPARLRAASIRWEVLEEQKGDPDPQPFSYRSGPLKLEQLSCHITHTNLNSHEIIRKNLHRSPLFAGRIKGTGPRYCPSIEDKVVKFADKDRHQLYLEPEGRDTDEIYINGLSTSLPKEVQAAVIHSILGLEKAEIVKWGYAIEYDCAMPTQLHHSLETKQIENLFLAGQINSTSGYEEAAAQGLMAGLNVIRKLQGKPAIVLNRSEAYIGVLIDDLVTRGTNEPYRMFTSRAEFRLLLRQDNADERLMHYGREFGLISEELFAQTQEKLKRIKDEITRLKNISYKNMSLHRLLKRPGQSYNSLPNNKIQSNNFSTDEITRIETEVKYEGYISRQRADIEKFKKSEQKKIPSNIDYMKVQGISREARDKLIQIKPESVGQASRIPGLSPCDLSLLTVHLERFGERN